MLVAAATLSLFDLLLSTVDVDDDEACCFFLLVVVVVDVVDVV
jgi:hypothetical protein